MSEQTQTTETTTATEPVNTPAAAVNQQPTVDVDSIIEKATQKATEAAEKKQEAVFKSMLQQQKLDTETINRMVAEWKSNQQTPEEIAAGKDKTIAELQKQLADEQAARIADLKSTAVESAFLSMEADPDTLELLMLKVDLSAVELDGKKVKNKDTLEAYKEQFPKLFKPKEEQKPDPEWVSAPTRSDPIPDREKPKPKTKHPTFF